MRTGSMGCGGSRSASIEPRYYESRDTESTWLTSTDTETQRTAAGNGTGASDNDNPAGSGQREEKLSAASRGSSVREKKLVNAGTQCSGQRRADNRDTQVKSKSKTMPQSGGIKGVRAEAVP